MARIVLIVGPTGSGKTRAAKTLDSLKTFIINVLGKDLPWKGSSKDYRRTEDFKNIKSEINHEIIRQMIPQLVEKGFENIIVDDARHIMENEFIKRAGETGWSKFIDFAQQIISILQTAKNVQNDNAIVFFNFHTEDIFSGQSKVGMKVKLVGKFVEEHFDPMEIVTVCLFTVVRMDKDGKPTYQFVTNKTVIGGVEYPAKSPEGMFSLFIDNDLQLVRNSIINYFKGEVDE